MDAIDDIVAQQAAAFAAVDAELPAFQGLPSGQRVAVDQRIVGSVYEDVLPDHDVRRLWAPRRVWEFTPLLGSGGPDGMARALEAFQSWLADRVPAGQQPDTGVRIAWPSRDVEAGRVLLRYGFTPMTMLAIRHGGAVAGAIESNGVVVRRATLEDMEELVAIHLEEIRFSSSIMDSTVPDNAAQLLTAALRPAVFFVGRVYLAELGGRPVGSIDCGVVHPPRDGTSVADKLVPGRWGYVGSMSVLPEARGNGIGRAIVDRAHADFAGDGIHRTFLHYEPANPLSSVFWPRHGYRPLWTRWVIQPATRFLG